jgi:hypothetical protein
LDVEWTWEDDADEIGCETGPANLYYEEEDRTEWIEVSGDGKCESNLSC